MFSPITRRSLLAFAAAGALATAACRTASPGGPDPGAGWTHQLTDGRTISLSIAPERIVTDTYALAAMWPYGIRPVGYWGYSADDPTVVGVDDLSGMEVIGTDAEFDLERLVVAEPDLVIGYSNDGRGWPWWPSENFVSEVDKVAPYVPIRWGQQTTVELIEEFRRLAGALGGDIESEQVLAEQRTFEDNLTRLADLAGGKKLRVLPLQANVDVLYVGVNLQVLDLLAKTGVELVTAEPTEPDGPWASLSWEQIPSYQADLIMDFESSAPAAHENPVWQELPAIKAGQLVEWNDKRANTYGNYGAWLGTVADAYEKAEPLG